MTNEQKFKEVFGKSSTTLWNKDYDEFIDWVYDPYVSPDETKESCKPAENDSH